MAPSGVVVDAVGVEEVLQVFQAGGCGPGAEPLLEVWWCRSTLPQVWGWYGLEWMRRVPQPLTVRENFDETAVSWLRGPANAAPLSLSTRAGAPYSVTALVMAVMAAFAISLRHSR